jgi:acyl-CoA reductase-like NAD-dependent aldehyde dehydrogenase
VHRPNYWHRDTGLFTDVDPEDSLAQEKIFGPVFADLRAEVF